MKKSKSNKMLLRILTFLKLFVPKGMFEFKIITSISQLVLNSSNLKMCYSSKSHIDYIPEL